MASSNSSYAAKRAASLANPTADTVFKQNDDSAKAAFVKIPNNLSDAVLNGRPFIVRASGRATTGGSLSWAAGLQFSSDVNAAAAATAANNTDVVTLTARTLATVTRAWMLEATLIWDSTSDRMTGQLTLGLNGETIETANVVITALTSINLDVEIAGFVITGIFGSSNASNVGFLDSFSLEVL